MKRFQEPVFEKIEPDQVGAVARELHDKGYMFVNINATVAEGGCELLYVFRAPETASELLGKTALVENGATVASITDLYPAAFVFENEAHDLFGIDFEGISIDYSGNFYTLSGVYPMNPAAAAAAAEEVDNG